MTRTTLILIAVVIAAVLGTAFLANAQQMDGKNCEWAYKKHQQHRDSDGTCREKSGEERGGSVSQSAGRAPRK